MELRGVEGFMRIHARNLSAREQAASSLAATKQPTAASGGTKLKAPSLVLITRTLQG